MLYNALPQPKKRAKLLKICPSFYCHYGREYPNLSGGFEILFGIKAVPVGVWKSVCAGRVV